MRQTGCEPVIILAKKVSQKKMSVLIIGIGVHRKVRGLRRKTYFDFDQKIQATISASVGDRLKFNMSYNTDATFDFDSQNLKLAYEGKEDDIVKLGLSVLLLFTPIDSCTEPCVFNCTPPGPKIFSSGPSAKFMSKILNGSLVKLSPPPSPMPMPAVRDSSATRFPVQPTVPVDYQGLMEEEFAADLSNPSNITTVAEYDPVTGNYIIHTRLGETDLVTPFMLTRAQYEDWQLRRSMEAYYRKRNADLLSDDKAGIGIGEGGGDSFDDTFCACTREKSPEHIPRMQRNVVVPRILKTATCRF